MCDLCHETYEHEKSLIRRKKRHEGTEQFLCIHCSFQTYKEVLLRIHSLQHRDLDELNCDRCAHIGDTLDDLITHISK